MRLILGVILVGVGDAVPDEMWSGQVSNEAEFAVVDFDMIIYLVTPSEYASGVSRVLSFGI